MIIKQIILRLCILTDGCTICNILKSRGYTKANDDPVLIRRNCGFNYLQIIIFTSVQKKLVSIDLQGNYQNTRKSLDLCQAQKQASYHFTFFEQLDFMLAIGDYKLYWSTATDFSEI